MSKKPVLLCIMDGFGWVPNETYGNAVVAAKTPHLDALMAKYPMTTIDASGMAVGLPDGQMGNSEVGHTNMGAGRIVYQQLTLITKSIKDGEMFKNPVLVKNMKAAIDAGKAIHLMGLVGTGGVHSHADHWFGVLEMAKHMGAKEVYLHCITDGRDTDPHAGKGFLADLQAKLDELGVGKIASVSGRYYAMDRDNNWDREEKAYAAFVYGEGNHAANAAEAIEASYAADVTDEFVIPVVTCEGGRVQDGDTVFLDCGTSIAPLGAILMRRKVRIVTYSTLLLSQVKMPKAELVMLGGSYDPHHSIFTGTMAEQMLRSFRFEHAFIGCYGVSLTEGKCYDLDMASTNIKLIGMENAVHRYLLLDDSKLEKRGFYGFADLAAFDQVYCTRPQQPMDLPGNFALVQK